MSKLLIEKMAEEVAAATSTTETVVEKTAEEAQMEKLAHEINVLDQSRTLVAIGEEMYKIASELENESLAALAADTYHIGERMGSCLTKTASEDGSALEEALEIAEDMHKIASVYAELADEIKNDETLNKMAEAIVAISNELTDEANEVYTELNKQAEEAEKLAAEEKEKLEKEATLKETADKVKYEAGFKGMQLKEFLEKHPKAVKGVGVAAALAAAGYGAKKLHDKK